MYWKKRRGKESCISKLSWVSTETPRRETGWLEKKQAALEKRQKELEEKAQAEEKKKEEKNSTQEEAKPIEKKMDSTENHAYLELGEKAVVVESLAKVIKEKDTETQKKIKAILESFKASKDEYTRSIGIYLSYLLK